MTTTKITIAKYIYLGIALLATVTMCLWPNFHPEQKVLEHYYWQADILIHGGYYFALTLLILFLRIEIKPLYVFLLLTPFSFILELLQYFSFKRGVSVLDMGSNLAGIGFAVLLYLTVRSRKLKKGTQINV